MCINTVKKNHFSNKRIKILIKLQKIYVFHNLSFLIFVKIKKK
jgi:hypothetical protein